MPDIEWLLRAAAEERAFRVNQQTVVEDAAWHAKIERLELCDGLTVWLTDTKAHRDVEVEAHADPRLPYRLCSHMTLAGRAGLRFRDGKRAEVEVDRALFFRLAHPAATFVLPAGMRYESVGYALDPERARRLLDDGVPAVLMPLLERADETRLLEVPADRAMRTVARRLRARHLNGPLRAVMIEGLVLQLLAMQAQAVGQPAKHRRPRQLSQRERAAVQAAHDLLLADMRRPPGLGELATAVGLSEKQLNAGFRRAFGRTVYEVLRDERLGHARALLQRERAPLKDVAFRVGYNHVTNFVRAFTARFGSPPRQYVQQERRGAAALNPEAVAGRLPVRSRA